MINVIIVELFEKKAQVIIEYVKLASQKIKT